MVDAGQMILHRIFHRGNIDFPGIDYFNHRVKRSGLSAAGRPANYSHSKRPFNGRFDKRQILIRNSQIFQAVFAAALGKQTHYHFFPLGDWHDGYAHIQFFFADLLLQFPVLRSAVLIRAQSGQNFQTGDQKIMNAYREINNVVQNAVNAEANDCPPALRLNVNIGCPAVISVIQKRVHHSNHGQIFALPLHLFGTHTSQALNIGL